MTDVAVKSVMDLQGIALQPRERETSGLAGLLARGCVVVAFLVPLKLSLTYAFLIPLVLAWGFHSYRTKLNLAELFRRAPALFPFSYFLIALTLGALFGLNIGHSISPLLSLLFFTITLLVFVQFGDAKRVLPALILGQSIASLHSILDSSFPDRIPSLFIGKVTEAGQLAVSFFIAVGLAAAALERLPLERRERHVRSASLLGIGTTVALTAAGFATELHLNGPIHFIPWLLAFGLISTVMYSVRRSNLADREYALLAGVQIPLLIGALLVNLKRGPWMGVTVGLVLYFALLAPKYVKWILGTVVLTGIAVEPIRDRIAASYEHFVISGGRSTIWRIGAELASKFPLGVGFHNSEILRRFAPEIPPELRHFHNNFLNISAESGWLATGLFMWFIVVVIRHALSKPFNPLFAAIGCGVVSWQVAGLGEYNVGDSEVSLVVWIAVGVLFSELSRRKDPALTHPHWPSDYEKHATAPFK